MKGGRLNPVSKVFTKQSIFVFLDTYEKEKKKKGKISRFLPRVGVIVRDCIGEHLQASFIQFLWTTALKPHRRFRSQEAKLLGINLPNHCPKCNSVKAGI
jgi:hypothetical protein